MRADFHSHDLEAIEREAAAWVMRHDRGLTATEQDEFSQWLAADARHGPALAEQKWGWDELNRLAGLQSSTHAIPDPDLLAPARQTHRRLGLIIPLSLAAAVALALGILVEWPRTHPDVPVGASSAAIASIQERTLADGSTVELNRGAVLTEQFTPTERHVRLERGEAHFEVTKDAARPFIVEAGGVAVRAVGTAFDVRLGLQSVEVLVTEGKVRVDDAAKKESLLPPAAGGETPVLIAGQRAMVPLERGGQSSAVATLSSTEIEQQLAWKPRLLDFTDAPLSEIVAEFNRHNLVQLSLGDASLGPFRLSAAFRSDNVEGFVRLMESDFGMRATWRSETEIVLAKSR
jgi:transmembrane sensor